VILFPIALIWLVLVAIWIIRKSTNDPDAPGHESGPGGGPRRFRPRGPRRPRGDRSESARRESAGQR
jgi:hypothetical protein